MVTQNAGDLVSPEDWGIQPHMIARERPVRAPFIEVLRALLVQCATDDTTSWSFARQTIYTTGATIDGIGPWVAAVLSLIQATTARRLFQFVPPIRQSAS